MKFNPYAVLLAISALMIVTVVLGQTGSSFALLMEGAASLDKDVSRFAARALTSFQGRSRVAEGHGELRIRLASAEKQGALSARSALSYVRVETDDESSPPVPEVELAARAF